MDDAANVPVKKAIHRSQGEIVLGCELPTHWYDVKLASTDAIHFAGRFSGQSHNDQWPVEVQATLYTNAQGYLLLGGWVEDDSNHYWWAELRPVAKFADEVGSP